MEENVFHFPLSLKHNVRFALDKKPGCRPIGIGEVLRRIIGKAIMDVVVDDVKTAVGNLQVCVGQQAGCEAAIHAVRKIYEDPNCEAVLMVDAANAFNNINRKATIHNIEIKCPSIAQYIKNTYSQPAKLHIYDKQTNTCETIASNEGTTQGDPIAMAMYALGLLKLQDHINFSDTNIKQVAYADDLTEYVKKQVYKWIHELKLLAQFAEVEPHSAYTAFTFGMKHKWSFLMRTVPGTEQLFEPLEEIIRKELIPALSGGRNPTAIERAILALPPRLGGLGITDPCRIANTEHQNSIKLTTSLTQYIIAQDSLTQPDQKEMKKRLEMASEVGASNWLTTLPIRSKGFSLNKQEFVDAISLRYGWAIDGLQQQCTCGSSFDPNHAMTCKTGGFVCMRHDEVRDVTAQMLGEVSRDVRVEPSLIPTGGAELLAPINKHRR
ncbi:uncharacterized protein LOC134768559 [Penaeus indicus]|uniref:uncharacterized protein LOC134768559 n=1 Tax=Penaeus indicus TaxID=29960 RepID=UPI00300C5223